LAENGRRRAFTPAVILFIALPEEKDNSDNNVGALLDNVTINAAVATPEPSYVMLTGPALLGLGC
jgi:hypothetical protein